MTNLSTLQTSRSYATLKWATVDEKRLGRRPLASESPLFLATYSPNGKYLITSDTLPVKGVNMRADLPASKMAQSLRA
jgi:hypothetical protein